MEFEGPFGEGAVRLGETEKAPAGTLDGFSAPTLPSKRTTLIIKPLALRSHHHGRY